MCREAEKEAGSTSEEKFGAGEVESMENPVRTHPELKMVLQSPRSPCFRPLMEWSMWSLMLSIRCTSPLRRLIAVPASSGAPGKSLGRAETSGARGHLRDAVGIARRYRPKTEP